MCEDHWMPKYAPPLNFVYTVSYFASAHSAGSFDSSSRQVG
jgi:hypothetical protein